MCIQLKQLVKKTTCKIMVVLMSSFKLRAFRIANENPSHRTQNGYISKSRSSRIDWTAKLNHKNLPIRRESVLIRISQIPHSETSPHIANPTERTSNRTNCPISSTSLPTQKYSLLTHVQGLRKVLHWKHSTIPTRSCERTFDQRQFVRELEKHLITCHHN